jgi:hypothetical protein
MADGSDGYPARWNVGLGSGSPASGPGFDSEVASLPGHILYFTSGDYQYIGKIDGAGNVSTFPVPGHPKGITYGPDGNLWYANYDATTNTSGRVVQFSPVSNSILKSYTLWVGAQPIGITNGKDGAIWFTDNYSDSIGRLTTSGVLTQYPMPPVPGRSYGLIGIGAAPDGSIWACRQPQHDRPVGVLEPSPAVMFNASEIGYSGTLSAKSSDCNGIATFSPTQGSGPQAMFSVVSVAAGKCSVSVTDANGSSATITVNVTTMTGTNQ